MQSNIKNNHNILTNKTTFFKELIIALFQLKRQTIFAPVLTLTFPSIFIRSTKGSNLSRKKDISTPFRSVVNGVACLNQFTRVIAAPRTRPTDELNLVC